MTIKFLVETELAALLAYRYGGVFQLARPEMTLNEEMTKATAEKKVRMLLECKDAEEFDLGEKEARGWMQWTAPVGPLERFMEAESKPDGWVERGKGCELMLDKFCYKFQSEGSSTLPFTN